MDKIVRFIPAMLIVIFIAGVSIFKIDETVEIIVGTVIFIITYLILFRLYNSKKLTAQRVYIYALFIAISFAIHLYHSYFFQQ